MYLHRYIYIHDECKTEVINMVAKRANTYERRSRVHCAQAISFWRCAPAALSFLPLDVELASFPRDKYPPTFSALVHTDRREDTRLLRQTALREAFRNILTPTIFGSVPSFRIFFHPRFLLPVLLLSFRCFTKDPSTHFYVVVDLFLTISEKNFLLFFLSHRFFE